MIPQQPQSTFWNKKRVLITGHTGFKGGWLALWLRELGATIHGVALPPPANSPSFFESLGCARWLASSAFVDICNFTELRDAVLGSEPEIVLHLAAQSLVRRSYAEPPQTFATNVVGTANVLEVARCCPSVRSVVVVTSDKCYENREQVWPYREDDHLGGSDPYSASKACAELVTSSYRRSFLSRARGRDVGVASVRAGNVFGGGDWADGRLIPDIVRAAIVREGVKLRYPKAVRPWQHVLEPLSGYLLVAEKLWSDPESAGAAWNFGPARESHRTVEWLVGEFTKHLSKPPGWGIDSGEHPPEHQELRLDSSRAEHELGWCPRLTLQQAVEMTAVWYEAYIHAPHTLPELTLKQLSDYQKLLPQNELT